MESWGCWEERDGTGPGGELLQKPQKRELSGPVPVVRHTGEPSHWARGGGDEGTWERKDLAGN